MDQAPFTYVEGFNCQRNRAKQRLKALHDIDLGIVDFVLLSHGIFNTPLTMEEKQNLSDVNIAYGSCRSPLSE